MKSHSQYLVASVIVTLLSTPIHAAMPPRKPAIEVQPQHPGQANYTNYKPQPPARVRDEVLRVSSNGSFISRCLRMITREGESKNFETITGQDGLTFGITDFATNGGILEFMKRVNKYFPSEFKAAFGENSNNLLDNAWIKEDNAGGKGQHANDNGLVKFLWLRKGLDSLLTNRHLYGVQLENFKSGKVEPSLATFRENKFTKEFTLAAMIGVANSRGANGMRNDLKVAIKKASGSGDERERSIGKNFLEAYVASDPHPGAKDKTLLENGFSESKKLSEEGLGHRARRAYQLFKQFLPQEGRTFSELGEFALAEDEKLPEPQP